MRGPFSRLTDSWVPPDPRRSSQRASKPPEDVLNQRRSVAAVRWLSSSHDSSYIDPTVPNTCSLLLRARCRLLTLRQLPGVIVVPAMAPCSSSLGRILGCLSQQPGLVNSTAHDGQAERVGPGSESGSTRLNSSLRNERATVTSSAGTTSTATSPSRWPILMIRIERSTWHSW